MSPPQLLNWARTVEPVEVQDLIDSTAAEFKPAIQVCYRSALRSFLRHNGYNSLPKTDLHYTPPVWHRGYKREEIRKLLSHLPHTVHKLFCYLAVESGLRAQALLELRYRHIVEDFEHETVPVAVRLEPSFYVGQKAAGHTFLGQRSVRMIRECLKDGYLKAEPDARLVSRSYQTIYWALYRARKKARTDHVIQPCHGFRKYFENALDQAGIDHEMKMIIEGHIAGTRARHYTERDTEQLRELYQRAYPYIDPESDDAAGNRIGLETWRKEILEQSAKQADPRSEACLRPGRAE